MTCSTMTWLMVRHRPGLRREENQRLNIQISNSSLRAMSVIYRPPVGWDEDGNPIYAPSPFDFGPLYEPGDKEIQGGGNSCLEFGYLKRRQVRLWAMAIVTPKKRMFSRTNPEKYNLGFWVEAPCLRSALKKARRSVNEFPAAIGLYICNDPERTESLAGGYSSD